MQHERSARRSYGSGSLFTYRGAWYGQWWLGGRRLKRKVGPKRLPGTRDGLTRRQAEARLRSLIADTRAAPTEGRVTLADASEAYLRHVEHVMGRKPTTVQDYRIMLRRHIGPFFGDRDADRVTADDVAAYMHAKRRAGLTAKTVSNHLIFLHGVFKHAVKRGWAQTNPVAAVDRPRTHSPDPDIRYLEMSEVEALLRAAPDDTLGPTERVLYLAAAVTGLRQGELVALGWRDVDWSAGVIRVRRNRTRGQWGTPKSRRSSRAVPMLDRVAAELERHFGRSAYQGDDDLVFCHPHTGNPYDASKIRSRFKAALTRAGLRDVRFHDLRHTYGTHQAAAGAPLRSIMEWMGHRDHSTTLRYADYASDADGRRWAERAFAGSNSGSNLSATGDNSEPLEPLEQAESDPNTTP